MKNTTAMIYFFFIVLIVYLGVNFYIFKHTSIVFSTGTSVGIILKVLFFVVALSYPLGRIFERVYPSLLPDVLIKIGSFWLGAMLYLTLFFILLNIVHLGFSVFGHGSLISAKSNPELVKRLTIAIYSVTILILLGGYLNALYPRVNRITINTPKSLGKNASLKIAAASDIHLGAVISNGRLERFVRMMNEQNPDIILLAGDVFDEDLGPVIQNDMGKLLSKLSAPLGVYAVTGNHEYIGGVEPAIKYLEEHSVKVLRDSAMATSGNINVIGRDDRQSKIMGGVTRKSLDALVLGIDKSRFTILLDHQPYNLNEAIENGIDLQISGHTHHGQMFPLNFITKAIFEVSRGHKQIENTHFYVSTGFGTWGPPIRIGNRPEIVVFDILSDKK
ncbi:MAG TPA: metallophosphoesterase [Bacteroidales bacterium]|jgi:hypothetical protein|nr:metallophosphoesterase [Bacteroidales bacterium]